MVKRLKTYQCLNCGAIYEGKKVLGRPPSCAVCGEENKIADLKKMQDDQHKSFKKNLKKQPLSITKIIKRSEEIPTNPECHICGSRKPGRWKTKDIWECTDCTKALIHNKKPPEFAGSVTNIAPNLSQMRKRFTLKKELDKSGWHIS